MTAKNLPNVGDVITSPNFAYGYYEDAERKFVVVDGRTKTRPVMSHVGEDERVAAAAESGTAPPKMRTTELSAYDPSRSTAKFIVEAAAMEGGGSGGHGPGDDYPDGWHVKARRLNQDGSYDPDGEVIGFYMTGHFNCMINPKEVQVVGKMQMRFV